MPKAGAGRDVLVGASYTVFICLTVVEEWENFLVRLNRDTIKREGALWKGIQAPPRLCSSSDPTTCSHSLPSSRAPITMNWTIQEHLL